MTVNNSCYSTNGGTMILNNCITDDPLLINPGADNYELQSSSPCIDTGDNTKVPAGVTEDLDGEPRIVNGGVSLTVDMGCYEYQP